MSGFSLILQGLFRSTLRFALLVFAIFVAFVAYGVVASVGSAMNASVSLAGADRLVVTNRMSLTQPLPIAYVDRVSRIAGVTSVAPATWFGGFIREPTNEVVVVAVDAQAWLDMHPELRLPPEQRTAFLQNRSGVLVGERLAQRMGWKLGDQVPLRSNFWTRRDGTDGWPATVQGIFHGADARTNTDRAFMHYTYLEEGRAFWNNMVQEIVVRTASPEVNDGVAAAIDGMSRNSSYETRTADESSVRRAMVRQVGDLNAILGAITAAAFLSILLIVGNSLIIGVRRRAKEFAIMRTLGFTQGAIARQVLLETSLLTLTGTAIGLAGAALAVGALKEPLRSLTPSLSFSPIALFGGLGFAVLLSVSTGLAPALIASRGDIVAALGRS